MQVELAGLKGLAFGPRNYCAQIVCKLHVRERSVERRRREPGQYA